MPSAFGIVSLLSLHSPVVCDKGGELYLPEGEKIWAGGSRETLVKKGPGQPGNRLAGGNRGGNHAATSFWLVLLSWPGST